MLWVADAEYDGRRVLQFDAPSDSRCRRTQPLELLDKYRSYEGLRRDVDDSKGIGETTLLTFE